MVDARENKKKKEKKKNVKSSAECVKKKSTPSLQ